jgi:hypothetical protein
MIDNSGPAEYDKNLQSFNPTPTTVTAPTSTIIIIINIIQTMKGDVSFAAPAGQLHKRNLIAMT